MFTRRTAMGLMASSLVLYAPARAQTGVVFRKSASSLDPSTPEMAALRSAIPAMRQSGQWDRFVAVHAQNWRQHHSWLFLPWHRAFLYEFELAVRRLTYDAFRMPYLDWDADTIPAMLYEPPFAHDGRIHGPGDSMRGFQGTGGWFHEGAPGPFEDFFGSRDYGGDDESYGHNLIHVFVGGDMGNIQTAPRDPLFWFHHANVDRLWWYWAQHYGCTSSDCYPADWLNERVYGVEDPDGTVLQPISARSLTTTATMGYDYESGPPMVMAAPPPMGEMATRAPVARPVYTTKLNLLSRPAASTVVSLPREMAMALFTASRAEVKAPLFVRSRADKPHEIRISLVDRNAQQQSRIFAMPMGGMEASYVKDVGAMLGTLAQTLPVQVASARLAAAPIGLRVEAIPLAGVPARMPPVLTECRCEIEAKTWD